MNAVQVTSGSQLPAPSRIRAIYMSIAIAASLANRAARRQNSRRAGLYAVPVVLPIANEVANVMVVRALGR